MNHPSALRRESTGQDRTLPTPSFDLDACSLRVCVFKIAVRGKMTNYGFSEFPRVCFTKPGI